jgi:hypothetical protein
MGAGTTSKGLVVSCVSRAVVLGRLWPRRAWLTRNVPPPALRDEWPRRVEACESRRLWRGPSGAPRAYRASGGWSPGEASAGLARGTTRAGGAHAARRPVTAPGCVRPRAPSGLGPLGPGGHGPACAEDHGPRPVAASLPVGAAHTPRSSADPCGPSSVVPRPAGSALPAASARRAVFGGAGDGCARRRATGAAACARRRIGSQTGGCVTCSPRPAAPGARRGRTAGSPLHGAEREPAGRMGPGVCRLPESTAESWGPHPGAAGLRAYGV